MSVFLLGSVLIICILSLTHFRFCYFLLFTATPDASVKMAGTDRTAKSKFPGMPCRRLRMATQVVMIVTVALEASFSSPSSQLPLLFSPLSWRPFWFATASVATIPCQMVCIGAVPATATAQRSIFHHDGIPISSLKNRRWTTLRVPTPPVVIPWRRTWLLASLLRASRRFTLVLHATRMATSFTVLRLFSLVVCALWGSFVECCRSVCLQSTRGSV